VTITEALAALREARNFTNELNVQLACSFSPLHLKTLLGGHLQRRAANRKVIVNEGIFGDLVGTVESAGDNSAVAIALEWQDLDPRLRYREGGAWGKDLNNSLVETAQMMLGRLDAGIRKLPDHISVALALPSLPLPPVFHTPRWQSSGMEVSLRRAVYDFASGLTSRRQLRIVSESWVGESSANRLDLKSDLAVGLPYTVAHADRVADGLAQLLIPTPPLKGIITDLDNTLWNGIVGEAGIESVRWDPASKYYLHGLYQKLLAALADDGILVAIASKNDPKTVETALQRKDLLISNDKIFPVEVHWSSKSESVTRILKKWNISADSVAFVDDTALELAEVESAHPGITCLRFPTGDHEGVLALLIKLRDLCGKSHLSEEDSLRLASLRQGAEFEEQGRASASSDDFLRGLNATIEFDFEVTPANVRILELINKTNQFNLNGVRLTPDEWQKRLDQPGAFVAAIKYEDKFGALGTIAVIQGTESASVLRLQTWVMSCRAFSRQIEFQTIKKLFERFGASSVALDFVSTPKNGPLQDFGEKITQARPLTEFEFTRSQFEDACPTLYHRVEETTGVNLNG
jgi:FkbH-like protein